mgnify:CR=1 FL=1
MKPVAKFISTLMHSRNQAHIFHLQTTSYAAHKALQGYYDDIVELIDGYVEMYQGRYGILTGYSPVAQIYDESSVLKYFDGLQIFVDQLRDELPKDGELNNTVDEISGLISSTIYKLKFLQ